MTRKLRAAVDIVSDIGSLGFDLQHHPDEMIAAAVEGNRSVNAAMFNWIVSVLGVKAQPSVCVWCRKGPAMLCRDSAGAMQTICAECRDDDRWKVV